MKQNNIKMTLRCRSISCSSQRRQNRRKIERIYAWRRMYLTPPIKPTRLENGFRTPIERANPRDAFCPTRNINTFFKKRSMSASCRLKSARQRPLPYRSK